MQLKLVKNAIGKNTGNAAQHYLLIRLAALAESDDVVRWGITDMAELTGMHYATVRKHIKDLERQGHLTIKRIKAGQPVNIQLNL